MCFKIKICIIILVSFVIKSIIGEACRDDTQVEGYIDVDVKINNVLNEYIVLFEKYYWKHTREKYIQAAFNKRNISGWHIVPRSNLSDLFPSDFDVIQSASAEASNILECHPAVKRVTLQVEIRRNLKYTSAGNLTNISPNGVRGLKGRHLLGTLPAQITDKLNANVLWGRGITGKGIRVAVFDTGLPKEHPHFRNVKERTNWTNEKSLDDGVSHGTFVSGIIASSKDCLGLAPDVELHIFRVFTNIQVSYTSWFLDAFNYAMFRKINVLNLSIGGPDFMDQPFVDKVQELSANRVVMVSAIGNDGPLYGTLNNPGDQSDVIGVGGINADEVVAKFSSRGMTTWELPSGYGRLKPDIVTYGSQVKGSNLDGGCRPLSGTSVASPVVAGAVALILSGAPNKLDLINPSSVKQILTEGATKLQNNNMFEQGYGKLNILKSMDLFLSYVPKITLSPPYIDYTEPYMWPYSSQPLYCGSIPSIINVTILNGISVKGKILSEPTWHPYLDKNGEFVDVSITFSPILWPWTGWIAIKIFVNEKGCFYEGESKGHISIKIETAHVEDDYLEHTVYFPITVKIAPKPPRHKRILWDQFHNLQYPPGYIPRDNLKIKSDPLDWRSDHLHTNFRDMYEHLRNLGYYIETLGMPYTCFNASVYGTLLIVDPEEEFFDEEIYKLQKDVFDLGLGVIIFADWYNSTVMEKMKFFDENTREWWVPDTGGANVPALNDMLQGFGISLSDTVAEGYFRIGEHNMHYASGTTLENFPEHANNIIISANLYDQGAEILNNVDFPQSNKIKSKVPVIGLFQMQHNDRKHITISKEFQTTNTDITNDVVFNNNTNINQLNPLLNKRVLLQSNAKNNIEIRNMSTKTYVFSKSLLNENSMGRLVINGDSNCIDSTHTEKHCFWLLSAFLEYTMNSHKAFLLQKFNSILKYVNVTRKILPKRMKSSNLHKFSKVVSSDNKLKKREIGTCETFTFSKHQYVNSSDAS